VRFAGTLVHIDTLDPANAVQRKRFTNALKEKLPEVNIDEVEAELQRIAENKPELPEREDEPQTEESDCSTIEELDTSRIVRSEQIVTPEVSGFAVPVIVQQHEKPEAKWQLYLRWANGHRECRNLDKSLQLPNGTTLFIHPSPGSQWINMAPAWSSTARRDWLGGTPVPDAGELFKQLCERINYFLDLPSNVAEGSTAILALWTMLTYCYRAWDAVPYLLIGGPAGSGKSRTFEILSRLVFRPLASSNLTAPALSRTLHDRGGTLLFDEAERLRHSTPEIGAIRSMLLAGYKRGGQATRIERVAGSYQHVSLDVYGPKAFACIAGLPPELLSRCIPLIMFRAGPDSPKPKRRIDADPTSWQRLRDDLHSLALEHGSVWLKLAQQTEVCPPGISGRAFELWQPLLALAEWIQSHGVEGLADR
jgi:hypothetical protein